MPLLERIFDVNGRDADAALAYIRQHHPPTSEHLQRNAATRSAEAAAATAHAQRAAAAASDARRAAAAADTAAPRTTTPAWVQTGDAVSALYSTWRAEAIEHAYVCATI